MPVALISYAELLPYVNVTSADSSFDSALKDAAMSVGDIIENYLQRSLKKQTLTEYLPSIDAYPGDGPIYLFMKNAPLDVAASVEVAYDTTMKWDKQILVENTDYFVDRTKGMIIIQPGNVTYLSPLAGYTFQECPIGFRVKYTAGYTENTDSYWNYLAVPEPVKMAAGLQIGHLFNVKQQGAADLEMVGVENQVKSQAVEMKPGQSNLIPEVRNLLKPYIKSSSIPGFKSR